MLLTAGFWRFLYSFLFFFLFHLPPLRNEEPLVVPRIPEVVPFSAQYRPAYSQTQVTAELAVCLEASCSVTLVFHLFEINLPFLRPLPPSVADTAHRLQQQKWFDCVSFPSLSFYPTCERSPFLTGGSASNRRSPGLLYFPPPVGNPQFVYRPRPP